MTVYAFYIDDYSNSFLELVESDLPREEVEKTMNSVHMHSGYRHANFVIYNGEFFGPEPQQLTDILTKEIKGRAKSYRNLHGLYIPPGIDLGCFDFPCDCDKARQQRWTDEFIEQRKVEAVQEPATQEMIQSLVERAKKTLDFNEAIVLCAAADDAIARAWKKAEDKYPRIEVHKMSKKAIGHDPNCLLCKGTGKITIHATNKETTK